MSSISRWAERLRAAGDLSDTSLRARVIRGASGTLALRVFFVGIGFIIQALLARIMGAAELGIYAYAQAWVELLLVVTMLGLHGLMVREFAVYFSQTRWGLMKGLLRFTNGLMLGLSLAAALGAALTIVLSAHAQEVALSELFLGALPVHLPPSTVPALVLALFLIPLRSLIRNRYAIMQALRRVVAGQVPEFLLRPLLTLLLLGGVLLLKQPINAAHAMLLLLVATIIAFGYGLVLLRRALPAEVEGAAAEYHVRVWIGAALPMFVVGIMYTLNARVDTLILGSTLSSDDVGRYSVALQLAGFINIILQAADMAVGSNIARLHAAGEMRRLQMLVTQSARAIFVASVCAGLGFLVLGDALMGIFGADFLQARSALNILLVSQMVNAFTGSVTQLMLMTHHEREAAYAVGAAALLSLILSLLLIPRLGINGAALANAASTIVWNILMAWFAWRHLRIDVTAFNPFARMEK